MGDWGKSGYNPFFGKIEDLSMVKKSKVKLKAQSKANSNENTQNPKDDQEKIADEGIQKHSEHTAENKQPKSKEDIQNTDESTCLCKFFKKIAEWMCLRKNKNSKKADENAAENNDAAKQEEMKQADTVEQPKEQVKLSDYLEIISKILGISAILGILIGGFLIFHYLHNIGQPSIFPDIITDSPALIATAIYFGSVLLFLHLKFPLAFLLGKKIKPRQNLNKVDIFIFKLIIFLFLIGLLSLDFNLLNHYITDTKPFIFLIFLDFLLCFLFYILGNDEYSQKNIKIILMCIILPVFVFTIYFLPSSIFTLDSIHFIRFAETPKNSSWYLLYNNFQQNNGFQETNGINKSDLKALKKRFNSNLCTEKELKEHPLQYYSTSASRENALYGYMAWNLGDTKVFCPSYVNNKFSNINNQITDNCIVISGKALQIMPEGYISTESIQQPKHDAKE